jgi:hypothetical protein
MGLLSMGGLALLVRSMNRNPTGRDMDQMSSRDPNSSAGCDGLTYGAEWWTCQDLNLGPHPDPKIHGEQARGNIRGGAGSDQGGALVAR